MSFNITGTLHKVFDTETKSDAFKSREFVIKTEGDYPQYLKFQLVQDRCELVERCVPGQSITVHFDVRGREWQGKYFTNLNAWKIEAGEAPVEQLNDDPL